jgi:hypothetical protein
MGITFSTTPTISDLVFRSCGPGSSADGEPSACLGGRAAFRARAAAMSFNVEINSLDNYLFQIAGRTSLQVLEKATGESLRDVKFLHFRESRINGIRTEVARMA